MDITEITRRSIVDSMLLKPGSFYGNMDYFGFLKRIWDLASMPSSDSRFENAEGDIWQHTVRNTDWDESYLLYDYLELKSCSDSIFSKFLEVAVHPLVGDPLAIAERVKFINNWIKADGFRLVELSQLSNRPIYGVKRIGAAGPSGTHTYEIVLSFAGEDRDYVETVAEYLALHGIEIFYDRYEEVTLWGKDLVEHLDAVYRSDARFCIMFISAHYRDKIWPNHERRSALARALAERQEYILPARFDDTELPGVRPTLGYVDLRHKTAEELGRMILQKLGRNVID
jgi:AbiJ N-terminal domain 3/TIR domain